MVVLVGGERAGKQRDLSPFIGRTEELATLAQALASPPAVGVVDGEAGVGKTRLVTEVQNHPDLAGRRLLSGSCQRIREPFPLGPVIEALRKLAGELAETRLPPVAGALRPLLPELAHFLPPSPEPLEARAAEQHRLFRGLVEVFAALGPSVVMLEDLHWADQHTLDFVDHLLAHPPAGLSLLLTFRGEEADPRLRTLTEDLPVAAGTSAYVVLAPLDAAQSGALAAAILGLDGVSEEFATYLREKSSGIPFVIEELLALMEARGTLVRQGGGWTRRAIDDLGVPAGVRDAVQERWNRLGVEARAVAEAAAVLQVSAAMPVLVATCRLAEPAARQGVDSALESGLLVEQDGGIGFRHVLAAQAIYEAVRGPRRQQLHARAASALGALDPVPLGQRAHHLRQAAQLDAWVEVAEAAAARATELGHDDEAARLLEEVLRHAPLGAARRGQLAVKLACAAHQVLHFDKNVVDLLSDVLDQELPRTVRGELRLRLALLLERAGADFRRQRTLLAEAVSDLEEQPALMAHAMAALGIPCVQGIPLAEHEEWLDRVLTILPRVGDPALQVSLLGKVAMVHVAVGNPRWRQLADRVIDETGGAPRQRAEVSAFHSVGANACYAGHLTIADRLLAVVLAEPGTDETRWRELFARATLALLDYFRGAWDGLAERADVLCDQLADHAPGRADAEVVAACLALARGNAGQAARRMREVVRQLAQRGAYDLLPVAAAALIRSEASRGEVDSAVEEAQQYLSTAESVPLVVSAAWALPAVSEALVSGGQADDAEALVARWGRELGGLDAPLAPAALSHGRGFVAAAAGSAALAVRHFQDAAESYEQLSCSYQAAQAREQAGSLLLRRGDSGAGAAELSVALTTFLRLGAGGDLDRASMIARQYGVSVPARHRSGRRGYGSDLSPREREVAELAAAGWRNQEIADQLFVSINTVGKHLAAAMRKLGVGSRAALARRLIGGRQAIK